MFSLNQKQQQQQRIDWEYITFLHLDRGPLYNRARIPSLRFSLTSLRHPEKLPKWCVLEGEAENLPSIFVLF